MLVGHELGYAVDGRPMGSISGTSASEASFESTGQARLPVDSCLLLKGCVVSRAAAAAVSRRPSGSPTDRLCPVPMMPVQSQGMCSALSPPLPAVPPLPLLPPLPPAPLVPPLPPVPPDAAPAAPALPTEPTEPEPACPPGAESLAQPGRA